jgi:nucleoside-diphosphate-sugar epimerase
VIVRPFSVYGEGEDERRFIPTVIRSLNQNEELNLMPGDHDWIYIDDLCKAIVLVLSEMRTLSGSILNVGTGKTTSNLAILRLLEKISNKRIKVKIIKPKKDDSLIWKADNRKILGWGWRPETTIEEGLKKVYEFKTRNNTNKQGIGLNTYQ